MFITYLLLGSNLGDSKQYISDALIVIAQRIGRLDSASSLFQTESWGNPDQPDFINQVVCVHTNLGSSELLKAILKIESELGRERLEKWGSRTIDIDILLFDNQVINTPDLVVPHPRMHERRFTLEPLNEIASDIIHPVFNKTINELLDDLSDKLFVKKLP